MMLDDEPDLETLLEAIAAEGHAVDLEGAVRRSGWESVVVDTPDGWILRFPRPGVNFEREMAILRRLSGRLPVPIPDVEWTGRRTTFAAYRKIRGISFERPAYELATPDVKDALAESLARFLVAMHASLSPAEVAELTIPGWDEPRYGTVAVQIDPRIPASARSAIEELEGEFRAMQQRCWDQRVVLHDDFNFSNMVLDGPVGELAGVWDFSCVRLGDPGVDLRYVHRDSPDLFRRVAAAYETLSGRVVDVRMAVLANRLEQISDAVELGHPEQVETLVGGG